MCGRQLSFEQHGLDGADKTQLATSDELTLIREVIDSKSRGKLEVAAARKYRYGQAPLAELVGVEHPAALTGMGQVAVRGWCPPPLTAGLGIRVGPP